MKVSRSFRPSAPVVLEGRVVPSHMVPHAAVGRPVGHSAAEIAQSNNSDEPFGIGTSDTIHADIPVAEQLTTTYNDGSTQTESLLKVPNSANNTVTAYETIQLRHNGGTQKVVDTESFPDSTASFSGPTTTHTITTTLPSGAKQTESYSEVITGRKATVNGTIHEANWGVETWTSVKIKHGPTTTTNKTITKPDGSIEHQKVITTERGDLDSTTTTTTTLPDGTIQRTSSATNVIRVQPPSS
jgi:hypothetical protein